MKKHLQLAIPNPCHEDWSKMAPKAKGKFCNSCEKTVFDFTKTSDYEIYKTYQQHQNLCGRFTASQLNRNIAIPPAQKNWYASLVTTGIFIFSTLFSKETNAQQTPVVITQHDSTAVNTIKGKTAVSILNSTVISGTITDKSGLPLPGATVILKGKPTETQTDFDGNFSIKASKADTIVIRYIGFITQEIKVTTIKNNTITLQLDEELLGEVVTTGIVFTNYAYEPQYTEEELGAMREKRQQATKNYWKFYKKKRAEKRAARKERKALRRNERKNL